jgi:hypothetical protein
MIVIRRFLLLLVIVALAGCDEKDRYKRAAEVAEKAAERQAEQNAEMATLNREVAEGTRRLVEADAATRKEIVQVHRELQSERTTLTKGFDTLESERRQIAKERRTESILIPAIKGVGVALVAAVVLGFCWTLLSSLRSDNASDAELTELLICDLVREQPLLLRNSSAPAAIEDRRNNNNETVSEGGER